MKNILLPVHDDAGQEARLQAALDLTRALSGHLVCLEVVEPPVLVGTEFAVTGYEGILLEEARAREDANFAAIRERLKVEDVPWHYVRATGEMAQILADQTLLSDIIVLNTHFDNSSSADMRTIVSDVVMKSGKPVLAVPTALLAFDPCGQALIAWNGSAEIGQTVRSITPLLKLSQGVTLVEIGKTEGTPVEEAAAYLSRHGISARIEQLGEDADVPVQLLSVLRKHQPDYAVLGAYSHSRLRETLFGGVTRYMLFESPVPLLLGN